MSELLPCCQCGESKGYTLSEGSTYRWWVVNCKACGGDFGECGADRVTNLRKEPMPERWQWADEHWNEANTHAQKLRERIAALEKENEILASTIRILGIEVDGRMGRIATLEKALKAMLDEGISIDAVRDIANDALRKGERE